MIEGKLKKNRWLTVVFALLAVGGLAGFFIVYARAGWHLFLMRPFWLGCAFLAAFGFFMMLACFLGYSSMRLRAALSEMCYCQHCGAECRDTDAFCATCGEKLEKVE